MSRAGSQRSWGFSVASAIYSVGALAADVASLVRGQRELFVIGHSLGAYIGLALASRWFGITEFSDVLAALRRRR